MRRSYSTSIIIRWPRDGVLFPTVHRRENVEQGVPTKLADSTCKCDNLTEVKRWQDARKYRFIVATHLDGQPMPLGGLGPFWAVYDVHRFSEMMAQPLNERFALCPWALYHIEVQST